MEESDREDWFNSENPLELFGGESENVNSADDFKEAAVFLLQRIFLKDRLHVDIIIKLFDEQFPKFLQIYGDRPRRNLLIQEMRSDRRI